MHTKNLSLKNVEWLILDECDRMLELGYKRDVETILEKLKEQSEKKRQTILLSATLTQGIEEMSAISMKHPKFIDAAVECSENEQMESLKMLTAPENLQQTFAIIPAKLRLVILSAFLLWKCRFSKPRKILVFMATQDMVDFHHELLGRCLNAKDEPDDKSEQYEMETKEFLEKFQGSTEKKFVQKKHKMHHLKLLKLHGSMEQKERLRILEKIKTSEDCVLFCTDVAARGLDLPQVDWIVQYNPPTTTADYVHR